MSHFELFGALIGNFWAGLGIKTVLGCTHAVKQLSFSSIMTLGCELILGSKTVLGSTHIVEQLSFSMFP